MTKRGVGLLQLEKHSSKILLSKIWNMEHNYGATKTHFPKNVNGAQSCKDKTFIPPKEIKSWAWYFVKGPWINSHDLRPIMSPHICIILLLKLAKKDGKEEEIGMSKWNKKVDEWHMKTKCPM
jgi:hypothetical protein